MGEDGFPWKGLGARRKGRIRPGCMGWRGGRRRKGAATAWGQSRAGNEDGNGDRDGNRDKEPSLVEPRDDGSSSSKWEFSSAKGVNDT